MNDVSQTPYISVVIPIYGCRDCLMELHQRLSVSLSDITENYEIIFVNDACPQKSWQVIQEICAADDKVVGINLSRNFGQIKALTAGLEHAKGDWIIVMDGDLQDRPEEIVRLYNKAQEGYDVVFARRAERQDTFLKILCSNIFYKIYDHFTGGQFDNTICNFSISRKCVMDNYLSMREQNRAFTLLIRWMGFEQAAIDVEHAERLIGKSSYNLSKRIKFGAELITAYSNRPLIYSIGIGFLISVTAFVFALYLIYHYFADGTPLAGWTSTIVSIYLMGGIILVNLGVAGLYIGYIFNQSKNRPLFIIKQIISKQSN